MRLRRCRGDAEEGRIGIKTPRQFPMRGTVILSVWLLGVSFDLLFLLRFPILGGEKKPHWFEPTSTLCHLYSVTLLSKEIKHFLRTAEFTKEKQASPFTSHLNSTLMNPLRTSPFIILILLRSHRESPSPLQSWNHHGS